MKKEDTPNKTQLNEKEVEKDLQIPYQTLTFDTNELEEEQEEDHWGKNQNLDFKKLIGCGG